MEKVVGFLERPDPTEGEYFLHAEANSNKLHRGAENEEVFMLPDERSFCTDYPTAL